jgi:membrane protease YdiL (CAAX protease family)
VLGAAATALVPYRREIDPGVAALMVGSAAVNAVGEELLWRGVFLEVFPDDPVRGCLWPLASFAVWHLAPQIVLPSRLGSVRFVLGAAAVGSASALAAWRGARLPATLLPHLAADARGVTAERFRPGTITGGDTCGVGLDVGLRTRAGGRRMPADRPGPC